MKVENVKITKVSLSMADHGCLTFDIFVSEFTAENGHGLEAMMHIMNVVGVDRWENLVGKYCRVQSDGWGSTIKVIGNIIEDKWFDLEKFFEEKKKCG